MPVWSVEQICIAAGGPLWLHMHLQPSCAANTHLQAALYKGAVLLAPMVSLEKASRAGLNPILM